MTYYGFMNALTTALLIAILALPMPYAAEVSFGGGMVVLGVSIGRWFGRREHVK